jgi:hypothetical protein
MRWIMSDRGFVDFFVIKNDVMAQGQWSVCDPQELQQRPKNWIMEFDENESKASFCLAAKQALHSVIWRTDWLTVTQLAL